MNYETLVVEIKSGIGIVWMNRPKVHNAYDDTVISELTEAMRALEEDPAVRVVVLAGAGESFCVGADLKWVQLSSGASHERSHADALNFATLLQTIDTLKKPTVARVHGLVAAGGVGLVAACDIAIAAYEAEFCLTEVRLGLISATTGPYIIRAMGERTARRYALSGETFTAAEAYRVGLISDITPPEELDTRINELLGQLILGGPCAQALSKEWLRTVACAPLNPNLINESALKTANASASKEGQEGIAAFVGKRKPAWVVQVEKAVKDATRKAAATAKTQKAAPDKKKKP